MIFMTKTGETFEAVQSHYCSATFEELPDSRVILGRNYVLEVNWNNTRGEYILKSQPIIKRFLKYTVTPIYNIRSFINPFTYIKEDIMSLSKTIILKANEGGAESIASALRESNRKSLVRASRIAESSMDFVALAHITTELKKYGGVSKKVKVEPKESKVLKIKRDINKVPDAVWDAIVTKVEKSGNIDSMDEKSATITLKKKDAVTFQKSVSAIAGMTVAE